MIADVVNAAIAGIGFCHAAGRLIFHPRDQKQRRCITAEKWDEPLNEHRERNICDRQRSCDVLARSGLLQMFRSGEVGIVRTVLHRVCAVAIYGDLQRCAIVAGPAEIWQIIRACPVVSAAQNNRSRLFPTPSKVSKRGVRLGERLFGDPRLSQDSSRSRAACHDLVEANGASTARHDFGLDGASLPLNTPTIFNATLNFRFGWEGKLRTPESDIEAVTGKPQDYGHQPRRGRPKAQRRPWHPAGIYHGLRPASRRRKRS